MTKWKKPSEYFRNNSISTSKMLRYEINGSVIYTNFGAYTYPYWNGEGSGYHPLPFDKSVDKMFDELIEKGYNKIRFVKTSTAIRGYTNIYFKADRSNLK